MAHTIEVRYSLQQLSERLKGHLLTRTGLLDQQVHCASVLTAPTLLHPLNRQLALARTRRSARRQLFQQRETDFLYQPTWAENTQSPKYSHPPPLPRPAASAPLGRRVPLAMVMVTGIRQKRTRERNKGKGKTDIALNGHYGRTAQSGGPDFEKVFLPEVSCGSWCESSVAR